MKRQFGDIRKMEPVYAALSGMSALGQQQPLSILTGERLVSAISSRTKFDRSRTSEPESIGPI